MANLEKNLTKLEVAVGRTLNKRKGITPIVANNESSYDLPLKGTIVLNFLRSFDGFDSLGTAMN